MSMSQSLIAELDEAIQSGSDDRRIVTLRRVTDLLLNRADQYDPEQIELFDDVLLRLDPADRRIFRSFRGHVCAFLGAVTLSMALTVDRHPEVAAKRPSKDDRPPKSAIADLALYVPISGKPEIGCRRPSRPSLRSGTSG